MKISYIPFILVILLVLTGCNRGTVKKEECLKQGLILKSEKKLNYRTGKYEIRDVCTK